VRLQKAYETFGKQADFYWVYIREAHPLGSSRPSPLQIEQPKTFVARQEIALTCSVGLNLTMPLLVDDISDTVARAFEAFPDRMYIIGKDGRIAYKGGRGPREFSVPEMQEELKKLITKNK
jgi:type I thyroxine 5'-deiodinase